ncbi:hypothetical protein SISSUDRAFT_1060881 [Sistotremastrum suecicum HHB10207 ss-3]|uniref:Uncharacterized protein n=1 Tax=Sistotremastrum suecicum HHB10207 ss-3 TaxID=1314776 RepID=A0A166EJV4_9AGAM|nr:hypothetical protein SISSUDRAFT_1060881 [Sistotremastrum suecicum HHB10207 ss-3]
MESALNDLLARLQIPLEIIDVTDLTPSLLLAIIESVQRTRIPVSPDIRGSSSREARVQITKLVLGVLEENGLSTLHIDPRCLARGDYTECEQAATLILQFAAQQDTSTSFESSRSDHTIDEHSTQDTSICIHQLNLTPPRTSSESRELNLRSLALFDDVDTPPSNNNHNAWEDSYDHSPTERDDPNSDPFLNPNPNCSCSSFGHPDASHATNDSSFCSCPSPSPSPSPYISQTASGSREIPMQYTGSQNLPRIALSPEISTFHLSNPSPRTPPPPSKNQPKTNPKSKSKAPEKSRPSISPQRTQELLNERARLLSELADAKLKRRPPPS